MIEHVDRTYCRCGVLLASCSDCRGWLIAESPRIARQWGWFFRWVLGANLGRVAVASDVAEAYYLALYKARVR